MKGVGAMPPSLTKFFLGSDKVANPLVVSTETHLAQSHTQQPV
jgi:hypothetical protein